MTDPVKLGQWLIARMIQQKAKTQVWEIRNTTHDQVVAHVGWHNAWRQYCYEAVPDTIWNTDCGQELVDFVDKLNKAHKAKKQIEKADKNRRKRGTK